MAITVELCDKRTVGSCGSTIEPDGVVEIDIAGQLVVLAEAYTTGIVVILHQISKLFGRSDQVRLFLGSLTRDRTAQGAIPHVHLCFYLLCQQRRRHPHEYRKNHSENSSDQSVVSHIDSFNFDQFFVARVSFHARVFAGKYSNYFDNLVFSGTKKCESCCFHAEFAVFRPEISHDTTLGYQKKLTLIFTTIVSPFSHFYEVFVELLTVQR